MEQAEASQEDISPSTLKQVGKWLAIFFVVLMWGIVIGDAIFQPSKMDIGREIRRQIDRITGVQPPPPRKKKPKLTPAQQVAKYHELIGQVHSEQPLNELMRLYFERMLGPYRMTFTKALTTAVWQKTPEEDAKQAAINGLYGLYFMKIKIYTGSTYNPDVLLKLNSFAGLDCTTPNLPNMRIEFEGWNFFYGTLGNDDTAFANTIKDYMERYNRTLYANPGFPYRDQCSPTKD